MNVNLSDFLNSTPNIPFAKHVYYDPMSNVKKKRKYVKHPRIKKSPEELKKRRRIWVKQYYRDNKEKLKAYQLSYYEKNKEKLKAYQRCYQQTEVTKK